MSLVFCCLWFSHWLLLLAAIVLLFVIVQPVFWDMWSCHHRLSSSDTSSSCFSIKLALNRSRMYWSPLHATPAVAGRSLVRPVRMYLTRWRCRLSKFVRWSRVSSVNYIRLKSTSCLALAHCTTHEKRLLKGRQNCFLSNKISQDN